MTAKRCIPIEPGDDEEFDQEDIVLEKNVNTSVIEVRGGTLQKLVERLAYHKSVGIVHVLLQSDLF